MNLLRKNMYSIYFPEQFTLLDLIKQIVKNRAVRKKTNASNHKCKESINYKCENILRFFFSTNISIKI